MSKHKGHVHHPTDKKLRKARIMPRPVESYGEHYPHEMKIGTNAKNQYKV